MDPPEDAVGRIWRFLVEFGADIWHSQVDIWHQIKTLTWREVVFIGVIMFFLAAGLYGIAVINPHIPH